MAIENEDILTLKQTISLAGVIRSRGVELKKKGRRLWGLCPFHADTEPGMTYPLIQSDTELRDTELRV